MISDAENVVLTTQSVRRSLRFIHLFAEVTS
jgi:hypothetical protein